MPQMEFRFKSIWTTSKGSWTNKENVTDDSDTTYGSLTVPASSYVELNLLNPEGVSQLPYNAAINKINLKTYAGTDSYISVRVLSMRRYTNGEFLDAGDVDYNTTWISSGKLTTSTYSGSCSWGLMTSNDIRNSGTDSEGSYNGISYYIRIVNSSSSSSYKFHPRYFKLVIDYDELSDSSYQKIWRMDSEDSTSYSSSTALTNGLVFQNYIPIENIISLSYSAELKSSGSNSHVQFKFKDKSNVRYTSSKFDLSTSYGVFNIDIPISAIQSAVEYSRQNGGGLKLNIELSASISRKYYIRNQIMILTFKYKNKIYSVYVGNTSSKIYLNNSECAVYIGSINIQ